MSHIGVLRDDFANILDRILSNPKFVCHEFRCGDYIDGIMIFIQDIEFLYQFFLNNSEYFGFFYCIGQASIKTYCYKKQDKHFVFDKIIMKQSPMFVDGDFVDNTISREYIEIFNVYESAKISFALYKK